MKKIILISSLFLFSCQGLKINRVNLPSKNTNITKPAIPTIDSNTTIMGVDSTDVNIFDPSSFSAVEVFMILLAIISFVCIASFLPYFISYIKKKRS